MALLRPLIDFNSISDVLPQFQTIDELLTYLKVQSNEQITSQANRLRASCQITVGGRDVTSVWDPHLISVEVHLVATGGKSDCLITIDDRDASMQIPGRFAPITVALGWTSESMHVVFTGVVYEVESECFRKSSGRLLIVTGQGHSDLGNIKTRFKHSMGEGEKEDGKPGKMVGLDEFLQKAAGFAGASIKVSPELSKIKRDFWSMNESFAQLGERLALELGGRFTISGTTASLVGATSATDGAGGALGGVQAKWGDNMIGWRIKPFMPYPQYNAGKQDFFKIPDGLWDTIQKGFGGSAPFGQSTATATLPQAAPNSQVGDQQNGGIDSNSQAMRGDGFVTINGEPKAMPGAEIVIIGARPGIDGTYSMMGVDHTYIRGGGFTTRVRVGNPKLGTYYSDQT